MKKQAPNILTGKDLDYLKDIYGWNYTSYKLMNCIKEEIEDIEIKKIINESSEIFYKNMNLVLNILSDGVNYE